LRAPRGSGGFGYDPAMWVPTHGCSVAELDATVKNDISHRALAARQMRSQMREVWRLG
jgi:XTP/dITP diphosphohydrolase